MKKKIKQVAVIGAGVMGATIAAHLANVGLKTFLLDIVLPEPTPDEQAKGLTRDDKRFRNKLADGGLQKALKSKPASFYIPEDAKLITIGNTEDNLDWIKESDWVVEVIIENLELKKQLFQKIVPFLKEDAILTSNTSGIPIKDMAATLPKEVSANFLGTHFFNPPRYMKLLEIIPGPDTKPEVVEVMADFCERVLGKGIVYAKDTPNFIANRIGTFGMMDAIRTMVEMGLTPEEVDKITGPAIGHAKSATFRTADLVGLDTLSHVAKNVYDGAQDDEKRDVFQPPEFMQKMVANKLLGDKTGSGFFKKVSGPQGRAILSLNFDSMEYVEQKKPKFASLAKVKPIDDLPTRLRMLFNGDDQACEFFFKTASAQLIYSANRIPEIADDIVNIDNAMKWGFAWELGPFEVWDALGLEESVKKMEEAGYVVTPWVKEMLAAGKKSFYKSENGVRYFYDVTAKDYAVAAAKAEIILLPSLKERKKLVAGNTGASLVDLGDGVACLEFHTKMNSLGNEIAEMVGKSLDIVAKDFKGLVIANHAPNFSVGANLMAVMMQIQAKQWKELNEMVAGFQAMTSALKFFEKPVVAAPAGMALGGGCEVCLHSHKVRAAAETYMGLVEVGVGLIPAGGGCKELLLRNMEGLFEVARGGVYPAQIELKPFVARTFESIAMAKVSTSAREAQSLGLMRKTDQISINRDYLINDAKNTVLAMDLEGFQPLRPRDDVRVMGKDGIAVFDYTLYVMHKSNMITDYDKVVASKVAWVLCGGNCIPDTRLTENYLLELEREAFVSLCGDERTQARIQNMLMTGKPLRN